MSRNKLFKVASINSLSVIIKLISGFAVSKFMAIFIGSAGMAITGNLSNFMQSTQSLSSIGFKNGIIKYIAECKEDKNQFKQAISSGFIVSISIGLVLCLVLLLFDKAISNFVFGNTDYYFLIKIAAFTMPFYSVHIFFIAVINGLKKVKDLVLINIISYITSAVVTILLMIRSELDGALLAIVITPFFLLFSLFFKPKLVLEIIQNISIFSTSKNFLLKITSFFSMTLLSGLMFPFIFLIIRNTLIDHVGLEEAGYWEAMRKISGYYMLFVYTLYEIYLLPLLAENKSRLGFKAIVLGFYKSVIPFVIIGFITIYLLKYIIVKAVFTDAFLPMQKLFFWQLIGDFFRILFLTISYQFLAKKMIKMYILCEVTFMIVIYFSSIYLIDYLGVLGAVKAHALSSFFYLLLMIFIFRKEFFKSGLLEK